MRTALSSIVALAFLAAASPSRAQSADPLPAGDGRDLVAVACSQCHYLGTIAKIRDGAAGWRLYVSNMVLRGAQLTPPEVDKVVNYLALNLGPGINLPPARPVALPTATARTWSKPAAACATTWNASPPSSDTGRTGRRSSPTWSRAAPPPRPTKRRPSPTTSLRTSATERSMPSTIRRADEARRAHAKPHCGSVGAPNPAWARMR